MPPGGYDLLAARLFFHQKAMRIQVTAGEIERVEISLSPNVGERKVPAREPLKQSGIFGCGVTERDPTGEGSINVCAPLGLAEEAEIDTSSTNHAAHTWTLSKGKTKELEGLVFELKWTSTQAAGRAMSMTWDVDGCQNDVRGEGLMAQASGLSPLRVELNKTEVHKRLNLRVIQCDDGFVRDAKACDEQNCTFASRVWSSAELVGEASPVDVGVTLQQPFELYLTAFYNQPVPKGYSALG